MCSDHNCKHGLLMNHFNLQFYIFPSALVELNPNKRPFVMTRSSFAGTSKYAFKWLGDNGSQWRQLHWSIVGKTEFPIKSIFSWNTFISCKISGLLLWKIYLAVYLTLQKLFQWINNTFSAQSCTFFSIFKSPSNSVISICL